MDLLLAAAGLLAYPVLLAACYYLITLLHELGHAAVALATTTGPVAAYVGAYGPVAPYWQFRLGRLRLYLHLKPRLWRPGGGYCQHESTAQYWQNILILLAGPILPLLVSGLGFYISMQYPNGWWRLPLFLASFLSFCSMLANLLGGGKAKLMDGREIESDGIQIRRLLHYRYYYHLAEQAQQYADTGHYAESARLYAGLAQQHPLESWILRNLLSVYWLSGQLDAALASSQHLEQTMAQDFTDGDRLIRANLLAWQGRYTEALVIYEQLLVQPTPYYAAYNSRGYTRSLLGQQEAALADFDHAIALEVELAYAYANRGLAWLRLGYPAKALTDITYSLTLSPTEAYGYRNRGLYYLEQANHDAALADFEQAQQLNPCVHDIEDCLRRVRQPLNEAS